MQFKQIKSPFIINGNFKEGSKYQNSKLQISNDW